MGDDAFVSLPPLIGGDNLKSGEKIVQRIIQRIHPTEAADQRRGEVVEYVRRLIGEATYAETFSFGSVPLKTYLPDGDIDLTVISPLRSEESLARDVLTVLQLEEQDRNSMFHVRDVQYIQAEVKLVKCLVQNIVVDISFQRVGGLCTLCFLEKVNRIIGKNHLFKRSILLIKAWCYYESRILGAHHGLISTYALETLILHIFHLYYPSLDGPLEVLFRFLDYFSQFDWLNKGVSLSGPILLDSMNKQREDDVDSLLSRDFLRKCEEEFGFAFKLLDDASHPRGLFQQKHLNIVDPLKANNNLGRSVNQGNFHRIQSAFKLGARKLGRILGMPRGRIPAELSSFFVNTLERHHGNTGSTTEPLSLLSSVDEPDPLFPSAPDFLEELFNDITKLRISELSDPSSSASSSSTSLSSSMYEFPKLSDLADDYDSCMRNLLYAAGCLERHHSPSHNMNADARSYYPSVAGLGFFPCTEDFPRSRGIGTYFPNPSSRVHQERRSTGRGRGSQRYGRHADVKKKRYLWTQPVQSGETLPLLPRPVISKLEFGSLGAVELPLPLPQLVKEGLADESEGESVGRLVEGYHLKDEDFPPLRELVQWNE